MELALGQYLTLRVPPEISANGPGYIQADDGWSELRFQNFYIQQNANWRGKQHAFLPFGFSGAVANRQGDNIDATLIFPNTEVSRSFLDQAIRQRWVAVIRVMKVDNLDDPQVEPTRLYTYRGVVTSGGWGTTELQLTLNSVLDAVGAEIPARSINQRTVGNVPISSNISLQ